MAVLRLNHIYKVYQGGVRAVNDFDLTIKDKSFVVLVGPSGCGKSTTLRMIAGLESITAGQLYIDNVCVNDLESKDRDIAMVFQSYALYPHMTVYQNMGFGLKLRHQKADVIKEKVLKAAEILEITDLLDRKPKELSGGQRQRVALGRAIVREPNIFLLDEPLSNLDAKLRVQMRTEITKLHEKLQTTFIYVTHDQTEAMTMGDVIVVMNKGFVQQADAPVTLFEDPSNLFVATFLGSPQMNIISGKIIKNSGKTRFLLENIEENFIELNERAVKQIEHSSLPLEKEYLLGIRPDQIKLSKEGIPAHVEAVEQLGDETLIYVSIASHKGNITLKAPLTIGVKSGDDVKIEINRDKIYLFDKETEHSLIGLPSLNKIPCSFNEGKLIFDKGSSIDMNDEFFMHLLDKAKEGKAFFAIKPEAIELKGNEDNIPINITVDFKEERTNYDIIYGIIGDEKEYIVFRAPKGNGIKNKDPMTIYLPIDKIRIIDDNGDSLFSKERIYKNIAKAKLSTKKDGKRIISISGGERLVYESLPYEDGEYDFELKQDKCHPVYERKKAKKLNLPETLAPKNQCLSASCYDEDPSNNTNIVYAKIAGFEDYITIQIPYSFSVYKLPKFKLYVPEDGFALK